jgi:hypothetical protein
MAQTIKIKRSSSTAAPSSALGAGELAYSFNSNKLFIGDGSANDIIGGELYVNMLDHTAGTLTASSAIIVDSNKKIDELLVDNLSLNANALTSTSGDIALISAQNLDIDVTGGTIDTSTQATEIKIIDNSSTSFVIKSADNNTYLSFVTTNSGEKITLGQMLDGGSVEITGTNFDINGGNVDGTVIGAAAAAAGTFTNITGSGTINFNGATVSNLGTVTTADINGGTLDGVTIGGASAGAGTFTSITDGTASLSSGALTGIASAVIDNLTLDGSTLSTTASNNNINLTPHGTGTVTVPGGYKDRAGFGTNSLTTKEYVDAVKQGLDVKESVRAASTTNVDISELNNNDAMDGVTLATGDRVLLKNQTTGSENGIYVVAASAGSTVRSSDFNTGDVSSLAFVFVEEGTSNQQNGYILTNTGTITVGSTALTFTQFSGAGQITAGTAMTKSGNTLNVAVDNKTIQVTSDALRLKGISQTVNGDILFGANGADGGYSRLPLGTYDSTNSVGQILQVGSSNNIVWTNTIDGGTFS